MRRYVLAVLIASSLAGGLHIGRQLANDAPIYRPDQCEKDLNWFWYWYYGCGDEAGGGSSGAQ